MKPQLLITLPMLLLATSTAFAADSVKGPYVGAGLGIAQAADTDGYGDLDPHGLGYHLYGGYYFNRIVGVEGGYTDYGDMDFKLLNTTTSDAVSPTSLSVAANLGYTFDNGIRPFALIGLSYVDLNVIDHNVVTDDTGTGFHFGLGVEYSPMPNLTLRAISEADAVNVENYYVNGSNQMKTQDSTLAFGSFSIGASYKF